MTTTEKLAVMKAAEERNAARIAAHIQIEMNGDTVQAESDGISPSGRMLREGR